MEPHKPTHPSKRAHRVKDGHLDTQRINVQNRIRATVTGTRVLDKAIHTVNLWLKELMEEMKWDNRERALSGTRAVLHALRDLLPFVDAVHFSAQLPLIIRGIFFESWAVKSVHETRVYTIAEFYDLVEQKLGAGAQNFDETQTEELAHAVLRILLKHLGEDEIRKIRNLLPKDLREVMPISSTDATLLEQANLAAPVDAGSGHDTMDAAIIHTAGVGSELAGEEDFSDEELAENVPPENSESTASDSDPKARVKRSSIH